MTTKADKSKEACIIHLDSKEAFNPVPNMLLMNRVRSKEVILNWTTNWLAFRVKEWP